MRIHIETVCILKDQSVLDISDIMEHHGSIISNFTFELEDLTIEQAFLIYDSCCLLSFGCRTLMFESIFVQSNPLAVAIGLNFLFSKASFSVNIDSLVCRR